MCAVSYINRQAVVWHMSKPGDGRTESPEKLTPLPPVQNGSRREKVRGGGSLSPAEEAELKFSSRELYDFTKPNAQRSLECPVVLMTDSYKLTHPLMYPAAQEMCAYGEFRKPFNGMSDDRIVVYGLKYYISQIISNEFKDSEIEKASKFATDHLLGIPFEEGSCFQLIKELKHFPVKIEVLPEGSVVRPHIPVYKITAQGKYSRLVTYLETMLTMVWYPSTVATLSRQTKKIIQEAYKKSVIINDSNDYKNSLETRLHDFGFRGCTCIEQSVLGGSAHLLSFQGSDTMSACYHVQHHLNGGVKRGISIPATEHSVMTSWTDEIEAVKNILNNFRTSPFVACVMDSYNYENALKTLLPVVKGIYDSWRVQSGRDTTQIFVIRPDSGKPIDQVLKGLRAAETVFGFDMVGEYKVLKNSAVIQGDGIDYRVVQEILDAVLAAGYSANNVAFGMGGGLLQKVNRDTMSFATKLCHITYDNGEIRHVMKSTNGEPGKWSLPGKTVVMKKKVFKRDGTFEYGPHRVFTEEESEVLDRTEYEPSMVTVYDNGKDLTGNGDYNTYYGELFQQYINRMESEWSATDPDTLDAPVSSGLKKRQEETAESNSEKSNSSAPLQSSFKFLENRLLSSSKQILYFLDKATKN